LTGHADDHFFAALKPVTFRLSVHSICMFVQVVMMANFVPIVQDLFDRARVSFHAPGW
jgi:hypothetical protein